MKIKNFLLALGSISLLVSCKNKEPKKIYLVSFDRYQQVGHEGELVNSDRTEYSYDERGNCIEEKQIALIHNELAESEEEAIKEVVVALYKSAYDENNNEIAYDSAQFFSDTGEQYYRFGLEWEMDEDGNLLKETTLYYVAPYEEPDEIYETVYYYNNSGVRIKAISSYNGEPYEQTDYTYNRDGLLAAKYIGNIYEGELYPSRKYGYLYYEGTNLYKYTFAYTYSGDDYSVVSKDYFEYDENGFQTLYETYEGDKLVGSLETVFTSEVSYKQIVKMERPDTSFGVISTTEFTFKNHKAMINDDREQLVSTVELEFDGYYSFTLPYSKIVHNYSYNNGECSERTIESTYYNYGTEEENSYYLTKEVYHYAEL